MLETGKVKYFMLKFQRTPRTR